MLSQACFPLLRTPEDYDMMSTGETINQLPVYFCTIHIVKWNITTDAENIINCMRHLNHASPPTHSNKTSNNTSR